MSFLPSYQPLSSLKALRLNRAFSNSSTGPALQLQTHSFDPVPLTAFILGFALENSFQGLILFSVKTYNEKDKKKRLKAVLVLMAVFNVISVIYNALFLYSFYLDAESCYLADLLIDVVSHSYYVVFDLFMLYKTYAVSGFQTWFIPIAAIGVIHRAVWGVADCILSFGAWNGHSCAFSQNPVTGIGASAADILCDSVSTVFSVWFCRLRMIECFALPGGVGQNVAKLFVILAQENILRSIIVLIINGIMIWVNSPSFHGNESVVLLMYAIQSYVFSRLLNLEWLWMKERTKAQLNRSQSHGQSNKSETHIVQGGKDGQQHSSQQKSREEKHRDER
ncbi:hypothetical protein BCR33DRAFT_717654 [Rhizoclosmatium globosum]|uniref:Uncharacterized protein n=1 Tax=Rhizoclosmatium globosum TaxID=329046 RepID=A0A1Y2C932_9FUNG|nr:hypothetical protein BCR33DRAFT_717654 [Rhizoclosmatium globosum]|eukprot:ORY43446.1 hypothetical protein BCR33DRAFT_717654 [Rhizoclosmatium globosum]